MATSVRQIDWIQRPSQETKVEPVLKKSAVSIGTVAVDQKLLTHERRNLLVLLRATFFCPNVAFCSMSEAFITTVSDKLGAVYSSDVDGKQLYEKNLDCKMLQVVQYGSIAFWRPPDIFRIALQTMLTMAVILIACRERSFSKLKLALKYLRASMTNNKSGQVVWSSCDEHRNGRNRECWLWWNHKRSCFDKGTKRYVLKLAFLCN